MMDSASVADRCAWLMREVYAEEMTYHPCPYAREPIVPEDVTPTPHVTTMYEFFYDSPTLSLFNNGFTLRRRVYNQRATWTLRYSDRYSLIGKEAIDAFIRECSGCDTATLFPSIALSYKVVRFVYPESYIDVCRCLEIGSKAYALRTWTVPKVEYESALTKFHALRLFRATGVQPPHGDDYDSILDS